MVYVQVQRLHRLGFMSGVGFLLRGYEAGAAFYRRGEAKFGFDIRGIRRERDGLLQGFKPSVTLLRGYESRPAGQSPAGR